MIFKLSIIALLAISLCAKLLPLYIGHGIIVPMFYEFYKTAPKRFLISITLLAGLVAVMFGIEGQLIIHAEYCAFILLVVGNLIFGLLVVPFIEKQISRANNN